MAGSRSHLGASSSCHRRVCSRGSGIAFKVSIREEVRRSRSWRVYVTALGMVLVLAALLCLTVGSVLWLQRESLGLVENSQDCQEFGSERDECRATLYETWELVAWHVVDAAPLIKDHDRHTARGTEPLLACPALASRILYSGS